MALSTTKKVARKNKTYKFNFLEHVLKSEGVIVKNNKLKVGAAFEKCTNMAIDYSMMPLKFYQVEGRTFCYRTDGKIAEFNNQSYVWFSKQYFSMEANVIPVMYNGKRELLVFENNRAEIVGGSSITLPNEIYSIHAITNNVLFTAKDDVVYFTSPFDSLGLEDNFKLRNFVRMQREMGKVVGLHAFGDTIYCVCQYGIALLKISGEPMQYQLSKVDLPPIKVKEKSVNGCGNNVFFISGKNFHSFDGKTLSTIDFLFENVEITPSDNAGECDGYYILPFSRDKDGYLSCVCINTISGEYSFTTWVLGLSYKGGYALNGGNEISKLSVVKPLNNYSVSYKSDNMTFETNKEKVITEIQCNSLGKAILYFNGDFGKQAVHVKGPTVYKCNLRSREFWININSSTSVLPIENLKITYQVTGE